MTNNAENIYIYLLATCTCLFEKCLLIFSFLFRLFVFFNVKIFLILYIFWILSPIGYLEGEWFLLVHMLPVHAAICSKKHYWYDMITICHFQDLWSPIQKVIDGAGEKAQQMRALAALRKGLGQFPAPTWSPQLESSLQVRRICYFLLTATGTLKHVVHSYTQAESPCK